MTFEKKCFIAPSDIVAVRFTCKQCHTAVVIPIEKVNLDIGMLIVKKCSQCPAESDFRIGTTETETLIQFNQLLAKLADALEGRNIEYSLQVECPE